MPYAVLRKSKEFDFQLTISTIPKDSQPIDNSLVRTTRSSSLALRSIRQAELFARVSFSVTPS